MPPLHTLVADRCRGDGLCALVCPKDILEIRDGLAHTVAGTEVHCLHCGQCVAVCPNDALALDGLPAAQLVDVGRPALPYDQLLPFLLARRSVRNFADKPVDRALIDQVLAAAATAPPGFPPHATEILVIDRPEDRERMVGACVAAYDKLQAAMKNPIGRLVVRLKRGAAMLAAVKSHVLQIVTWDNQRHRSRGVDRYLYGAPVVMLLHGDRAHAAMTESAMVVATYITLAAHALGLGATMLSIVPPMLNNVDAAYKRELGIPDEHQVVIAVILGHPRVKYARAIRREMKTRYLRT